MHRRDITEQILYRKQSQIEQNKTVKKVCLQARKFFLLQPQNKYNI